MELKNIARSVLLHWMEKQKTLSPTVVTETALFADAARMLGLLSGLLAEMAEELVAAAAEASAPAETTTSVEEAAPSEGIISVKEATVLAENTAVSTTVIAPAEEAVRAEETPAPAEQAPAPVEKTPAPVEEIPVPVEETPAPAEETPAPQPTDKERDAAQQAARMDGDIQAFLDRHYDLRFNLLTETTEYRPKGGGDFRPLDARVRNGICLHAHAAGIGCWDRDVTRVIESGRVADYHPFRRYFDTLPAWDGRDRLRELAARVSSDGEWAGHFHRWMLGVAAQWSGVNDGLHAQSVAPLLVSDEQGMGKSTFCRSLMPPELAAYYTDSVDLSRPGTVERHLVEMGLINLDEFDRIPSSRQPQLKNVMQLSALHLRRAYRRHAGHLPRVASFIGTSNSRELLTDPTGSRRFICVSVERPIRVDGIDHAQVYAQLKAELQAGERYWFSKEEEECIRRGNLSYYRVSPVEEVFRHCFRAPRPGEQGVLRSLPELLAVMRRRCPGAGGEVKMRPLSRSLVAAGVKKVHTAEGNRYLVVQN